MIVLRAPENFVTSPPGGGVTLADGRIVRPDREGNYIIDEAWAWAAGPLRQRLGFRLLEEIEAEEAERRKRESLSPIEREVLEHPLDLGDIIDLAAKENIRFRVEGDELQWCGPSLPSARLAAHVHNRREQMLEYLARISEWRKFE